jgi:glycosyltransferase involved in cell wall biosynthesis
VDARNLDIVRQVIEVERPDAALIWGMWNIPRAVPALVEELLPKRVAYYFCDYWPSLPSAYLQRWEEGARRSIAALPKRIAGLYFRRRLIREPQQVLRLERPICVSQAVRSILVSKGVPVQHAAVIYGGTQLDVPHVERCEEQTPGASLKLMYLGRLEQTKGVHTAIAAMALLGRETELKVTLDIYGAGDADYTAKLGAQIARLALHDRVRLRGRIPPHEVPALLTTYDALLFPSEWEEPFARTVLEAMAAGLTVVGTTTGGTGELLVESETGLTFPAGDAHRLAQQVERIARHPQLSRQLAARGRARVQEHFSFARMVNALEQELVLLASSTAA